jgi:hypothetical protein
MVDVLPQGQIKKHLKPNRRPSPPVPMCVCVPRHGVLAPPGPDAGLGLDAPLLSVRPSRQTSPLACVDAAVVASFCAIITLTLVWLDNACIFHCEVGRRYRRRASDRGVPDREVGDKILPSRFCTKLQDSQSRRRGIPAAWYGHAPGQIALGEVSLESPPVRDFGSFDQFRFNSRVAFGMSLQQVINATVGLGCHIKCRDARGGEWDGIGRDAGTLDLGLQPKPVNRWVLRE